MALAVKVANRNKMARDKADLITSGPKIILDRKTFTACFTFAMFSLPLLVSCGVYYNIKNGENGSSRKACSL
jgi:predicted PolB exonuclease-like 3'-5' exonuclease